MTDPLTVTADPTNSAEIASLRARTETLERQLREASETAASRLVRAELKAEAVRAGMIDLDGLKLIDPAEVTLTAEGEVTGGAALMQKLRRTKPWLFGATSSSNAAAPPPAHPPRARLATDMTFDEWRTARAEMLKRHK